MSGEYAWDAPLGTTDYERGVWLDGAMGWHNSYRLILEIAVPAGWDLTPGDAAYVEAYRTGAETMVSPQSGDEIGHIEIADAVYEIGVEALDWLNDHVAPGCVLEWLGGDLVMSC